MIPPIIVVHDQSELSAARAEVEADGWLVHEGFAHRAGSAALGRPSGDPAVPGTVLMITLDDEDSASAALIGLVRGHGLLALLAARDDLAARFLDDLLRFGRIDHRPGTPATAGNVDLDGLTLDGVNVYGVDLDLLRLLGDGSTVTQASKALHISRRTANRRLIALRQAYGVATTAQLVSRSRSLEVIVDSDRTRR